MDRIELVIAELEKFRGIFSDVELEQMFADIKAKYL